MSIAFRTKLIFLPKTRWFFIVMGNLFFRLLKNQIKFQASNEVFFKVRFKKYEFFVRKQESDISRVNELFLGVNRSRTIFDQVRFIAEPTLLIDFGSNIGTSLLQILSEYNSIDTVLCFEADEENYSILRRNTELIRKNNENINIETFNSFVSDSGVSGTPLGNLGGSEFGSKVFGGIPDSEETGAVSGFKPDDISAENKQKFNILKIDIEGGEKDLFNSNFDYLEKNLLIIVELHDRYMPSKRPLSKNILKFTIENNYLCCPVEDCLVLLNTKFLKEIR